MKYELEKICSKYTSNFGVHPNKDWGYYEIRLGLDGAPNAEKIARDIERTVKGVRKIRVDKRSPINDVVVFIDVYPEGKVKDSKMKDESYNKIKNKVVVTKEIPCAGGYDDKFYEEEYGIKLLKERPSGHNAMVILKGTVEALVDLFLDEGSGYKWSDIFKEPKPKDFYGDSVKAKDNKIKDSLYKYFASPDTEKELIENAKKARCKLEKIGGLIAITSDSKTFSRLFDMPEEELINAAKRPMSALKKISDSKTKDDRSDLTNIKVLKKQDYADFDEGGKKHTLYLVEYTPQGALDDGDNTRLYATITDYHGEKVWTNGAIVDVSRRLAEDTFKRQLELATKGRKAYLRGDSKTKDSKVKDYKPELLAELKKIAMEGEKIKPQIKTALKLYYEVGNYYSWQKLKEENPKKADMIIKGKELAEKRTLALAQKWDRIIEEMNRGQTSWRANFDKLAREDGIDPILPTMGEYREVEERIKGLEMSKGENPYAARVKRLSKNDSLKSYMFTSKDSSRRFIVKAKNTQDAITKFYNTAKVKDDDWDFMRKIKEVSQSELMSALKAVCSSKQYKDLTSDGRVQIANLRSLGADQKEKLLAKLNIKDSKKSPSKDSKIKDTLTYIEYITKYHKPDNFQSYVTWCIVEEGASVDEAYRRAKALYDSKKSPNKDSKIKDDRDLDAQLEAAKILKKYPETYAVIYAYQKPTGGKVYLNPPLRKRSQKEVEDYENSFRNGGKALDTQVYVVYRSQLDKYEKYLK